MEKKLTEEEIEGIRDLAREFVEKGNVLPDDEYQEGLRSGVPIICSRWRDSAPSEARQVWKNEGLRNVLRRECAICKHEIVLAELNKDATFPICIECFMEHHEELTKEKGE